MGLHIDWPARNPNLTYCDFFLWDYIKELDVGLGLYGCNMRQCPKKDNYSSLGLWGHPHSVIVVDMRWSHRRMKGLHAVLHIWPGQAKTTTSYGHILKDQFNQGQCHKLTSWCASYWVEARTSSRSDHVINWSIDLLHQAWSPWIMPNTWRVSQSSPNSLQCP
jgi:hypothetical protein